MSLIIARVVNGNVFMLGDTKLTFENRVTSNPFVDGCLKQYIVSNTLAIAFAGNSAHFCAEISILLSFKKSDEIIAHAINAQKKGADFQLMVTEIGAPHIKTVKGGVLKQSKTGYVGDAVGYSCFQESFHKKSYLDQRNFPSNIVNLRILRIPEPCESEHLYSQLFNSFKCVIWSHDVPTVGGVIVSLCSDNGKFSYMNYADVISDPIKISEYTTSPKAINFGTAESGGYAVEFNENSADGGDGREIGFYFLQGGFGIYFPEDNNRFRYAKVIVAESPAHWNFKTKEIIGTAISSQFITPDHCRIAAEQCISFNNFIDAIKYYEMANLAVLETKQIELIDRFYSGYAYALIRLEYFQRASQLLTSAIVKHGKLLNCINLLVQISK